MLLGLLVRGEGRRLTSAIFGESSDQAWSPYITIASPNATPNAKSQALAHKS
jgi:hypothetical protein